MAENISDFLNLPDFAMPNFTIFSVFDIALITFASYKLLGWVRQTRAWGVFQGILFLVLIYIIALFLGMYTTVWLIEQIVPWAAIGLVVLFQPELRKAFEKLGKGGRRLPFITNLEEERVANSTQIIEEIIAAATKMSAVKTGGLVVIEQETKLSDIEATGVTIDAMVTSQLLLSIFESTSPLHDGAVIVRQNRIKAATCILPLTTEHLSSDLGTRHRAAVGTSETSDAYILVVSEETGGISIAKDGKLYRNLNITDLRNMLLSGIRPARTRKTRRQNK
ncbi:MAG: diadenylate cyclase CdaA [Defluviitaleaceae bacterium]|nr:diadenylate cyclase CdaA [Defluviitaleaceae bacterium]